jgi:hypothetical protein
MAAKQRCPDCHIDVLCRSFGRHIASARHIKKVKILIQAAEDDKIAKARLEMMLKETPEEATARELTENKEHNDDDDAIEKAKEEKLRAIDDVNIEVYRRSLTSLREKKMDKHRKATEIDRRMRLLSTFKIDREAAE